MLCKFFLKRSSIVQPFIISRAQFPSIRRLNTSVSLSLSPAVRYLIELNHLDTSLIKGTGPKGRILKGDVLSFLANPTSAPKTKPEEATKKAEPSSQIQPPSSRFVASTAKAPHYYFSMDVDLSEIVGLQKLFKEQEKLNVGLEVFIAKAIALSLRENPEANVFFDQQSQNLKQLGFANVGILLETQGKAIYPIISNAAFQSLGSIAQTINKAIELTKSGNEFQNTSNASFTVFSSGYAHSSTAIIPPFQAGIIAIGNPQSTVKPKNGQIISSQKAQLTLSLDPRAVDEITAARLLEALAKYTSNPRALM